MKTIWLASALAFSALSAPLSAQTFNSKVDITTFTESSVRPVLTELGAEITGRDKMGELERITIKFANGFVADIVMKACLEDGRCVGARIEARWDKSADFTTADDEAWTAWFNKEYDFTKSGVDENGKLFIQRYVISDRGLAQGTLYDELLNFQEMTKIFDDEQGKRE